MADVVGTFKKFPLSLQLIVGGALVFVVGSLFDLYSHSDNLLSMTTGIVAVAAMVFGAVVSYMKKMKLWALVAILLASGGVIFMFLQSFLDNAPNPGVGLWLLTIGACAASWGAITAEAKA